MAEGSKVCGTDVHIWHGRLAGAPYPINPGHVSVGVADKIRGEVRGVDGWHVREGDTLAFFDVHRTCGRRKHLEIRGCWGSEVRHFVRALRVLEAHHAAIPWRAIGARTCALSELNRALADAEAMRLPKALVRPH